MFAAPSCDTKNGFPPSRERQYHFCHVQSHLVYYEIHSDIYEAITREKRIKKWNRQWKINLIEQNNPQWLDLGIGLF